MLTYGDGVSDIDIYKLLNFHKSHNSILTVTAINVDQRFGVLEINENDEIKSFREKSVSDGSRINAGYMVCEPEIFNYIHGDSTILEKEPLETIAKMGKLLAYKHNGYWQCMDTKREKDKLDELWNSGKAPWKTWE